MAVDVFILIMTAILLVLGNGIMILFAFIIGARTAQKLDRGEKIELPNINPMQTYREHREKVEASKEQERLNTMLENINNYNGTSLGQKDVL